MSDAVRNALLHQLLADEEDGVERSLAEYQAMFPGYEGLVEDELAGATSEASSEELSPVSAPQEIGPYRIVERIGTGGMGDVYRAEQRGAVEREVALKVIKLGMDTHEVLARFDAERQALAIMDHPNIATVLEAGATSEGRPYFAMEYVRGEPITEYCRGHDLGLEARLDLFVTICDAVQHAHRRGVIHRDLKPSNVLVADVEGRPVPKVIDFGIAKAMHGRLTERSLHTLVGKVLGTPEYMSPEQADSHDVDTRSDVYSLGVMLYELLTDTLPFDSGSLRASYEDMMRVLRDVDPRAPSTRIGPEAGADLRRRVRGDLDWITLKALEKDAQRRYQSPHELAADLGRARRFEPITAGRPSTIYRTRKFVRRHRLGVLVSLLISLALASTAGVYLGMERSAATTRRDAEQKAYASLQAADELRGRARATEDAEAARLLWAKALGEGRNARDLVQSHDIGAPLQQLASKRVVELEQALARADAAAMRRVRYREMIELLETVWLPVEHDLRKLSWLDADLVRQDESYEAAFQEFTIPFGDLAEQRNAGRLSEDMSTKLAIALDYWSLVRRERSGDLVSPTWRELVEMAIALDPHPWRVRLRRLLLEDTLSVEALRELAKSEELRQQEPATYWTLAEAVSKAGDPKTAFAVLEAGLFVHPGDHRLHMQAGLRIEVQKDTDWKRAAASYAAALAAKPTSIEARHRLAMALEHAGNGTAAIPHFEALLRVAEDPSHWHYHLGATYAGIGDHEKAEREFRAALRIEPRYTNAKIDLGSVLLKKGLRKQAVELYESAAADPECVVTSLALSNLIRLSLERGDREQARQWTVQVEKLDFDFSSAWIEIGNAWADAGDTARARDACRRALELAVRDKRTHETASLLGWLQLKLRDFDAAITTLRQAVKLRPLSYLGYFPWSLLGQAQIGNGKLDAAEKTFRKLLTLPADEERQYAAHMYLGIIATQRGDAAAAVAAFRGAVALKPLRWKAQNNLGNMLRQAGQFAESVAAVERALELVRGQPQEASVRGLLEHNRATAALADLLDNPAASASAARLIDAALLGARHERHLASAKTFAAAFARDPEAMRPRGRLLEAAIAAVRASEVVEEPGEASRWRTQSIEWLRADLAIIRRALQGRRASTKKRALATLRAWQVEPRLKAVREQAALTRLPDADCEAWWALWRDIAATIRSGGIAR